MKVMREKKFNQSTLTYEWKYNMIYIKTLHFLFWSHVLFFVNSDFYDHIVLKINQCLFFSSILYAYKF